MPVVLAVLEHGAARAGRAQHVDAGACSDRPLKRPTHTRHHPHFDAARSVPLRLQDHGTACQDRQQPAALPAADPARRQDDRASCGHARRRLPRVPAAGLQPELHGHALRADALAHRPARRLRERSRCAVLCTQDDVARHATCRRHQTRGHGRLHADPRVPGRRRNQRADPLLQLDDQGSVRKPDAPRAAAPAGRSRPRRFWSACSAIFRRASWSWTTGTRSSRPIRRHAASWASRT